MNFRPLPEDILHDTVMSTQKSKKKKNKQTTTAKDINDIAELK